MSDKDLEWALAIIRRELPARRQENQQDNTGLARHEQTGLTRNEQQSTSLFQKQNEVYDWEAATEGNPYEMQEMMEESRIIDPLTGKIEERRIIRRKVNSSGKRRY